MLRCYRFPSMLVRVAAIGALAGLPIVAHAGVELRAETTFHTEDPPRVESTTTLAHDGSLRINVASPAVDGVDGKPLHATIFRGAFEDFLVVDHGEEMFTLLDRDAIADIEARLQYTMLQIDKQMAEMPMEARRRMREALAAQTGLPEPTVVKTETVEERNGFKCRLFEFRRGEELVKQVWVAPWEDIAGGAELRAALEKLSGFTARLEEAFKSVRSEALGGAQVFDIGENPFEDFEELGGLPVHTIEFKAGKPSFETSVVEASQRQLTQRDFLPPESYSRKAWSGE